jgi:hypothetical protein
VTDAGRSVLKIKENIIIKHAQLSVVGKLRLLRSVKSIPCLALCIHLLIQKVMKKREYAGLLDPVNRTNECLQQIVSV